VAYWDKECAQSLPQMDILIAQNVFAHTSDPFEFLVGCKEAMGEDSILFIQTSQANMFLNNEFDTIYHEHISFFSSKSMNALCERSGLQIMDVFKPNIHGTSYVFVVKKTSYHDATIRDEIKKEELAGRYDPAFYYQYSKNVTRVVNDLKSYVSIQKDAGKKVVGYGAAAKGNVLLNFTDLKLDYIIDDNPLKQGLKTPGTDIEIYGPQRLTEEKEEELIVIPLAWNFFDEISNRVRVARGHSRDTFVRYFPTLKIEKGQ